MEMDFVVVRGMCRSGLVLVVVILLRKVGR